MRAGGLTSRRSESCGPRTKGVRCQLCAMHGHRTERKNTHRERRTARPADRTPMSIQGILSAIYAIMSASCAAGPSDDVTKTQPPHASVRARPMARAAGRGSSARSARRGPSGCTGGYWERAGGGGGRTGVERDEELEDVALGVPVAYPVCGGGGSARRTSGGRSARTHVAETEGSHSAG
jgi:hypothetical protein